MQRLHSRCRRWSGLLRLCELCVTVCILLRSAGEPVLHPSAGRQGPASPEAIAETGKSGRKKSRVGGRRGIQKAHRRRWVSGRVKHCQRGESLRQRLNSMRAAFLRLLRLYWLCVTVCNKAGKAGNLALRGLAPPPSGARLRPWTVGGQKNGPLRAGRKEGIFCLSVWAAGGRASSERRTTRASRRRR